MSHQQIGKWIILAGVAIVVAGLLIYFAGHKLKWIGNLPGDIRIEKENVNVYFPITTMIILSVLLTILFRLINLFK